MMGKSIHSKTTMHSGGNAYHKSGYEDQKTKCRLLKVSLIYTHELVLWCSVTV